MRKMLSLFWMALLANFVLMGCATAPSVHKERTFLRETFEDEDIMIENVSFPSITEKEIIIPATLYIPKSGNKGSFPVVILIHGVFGLQGYEHDYAKKFCSLGYKVLLPDFFSPRKISHMSIAAGMRQKKVWEITSKWITDIYSALKYLEKLGTKASDIVLFGWSGGGTNALWVASTYEKNLGAAIAYYPGCNYVLSVITRTQIPLLLIQAEYDDWPFATKKDCIPQMEMLQKINLPIEYYIVKGAHHCFDNPKIPRTPQFKHGCTLEYSPRATAEAWEVSMSFLERRFKRRD